MGAELQQSRLETGLAERPAQAALVVAPEDARADRARDEGLLVRGLTGAVRLSLAAAALPARLAWPVVMSRPLQPARAAADDLLHVTVAAVTVLLRERAQLTDELVRLLADRYVAALAVRPELLAVLVQNVADGYIAYLRAHPEELDLLVQGRVERYFERACAQPAPLQRVVETHGDRYIEHLNAQPANVQALLAGQSASMATEVVEQVRSRSAAADTLAERVARGLLRRKPRQELGPPALAGSDGR